MNGKINIYTCYNPATDTLTIKLPDTDLIADRKTGILRIVDEKSEGEFSEHGRSLCSVMFADVVNYIINKTKGYESGYGA